MPVGVVTLTSPTLIATRGSKHVRRILRERTVEHWCCEVV